MPELSSNIKFLVKDGKSLSNFGKLVKHSVSSHTQAANPTCPPLHAGTKRKFCYKNRRKVPLTPLATNNSGCVDLHREREESLD
jgi:hypothetical protein